MFSDGKWGNLARSFSSSSELSNPVYLSSTHLVSPLSRVCVVVWRVAPYLALINVTARSIKANNCIVYNVVDDSEEGLILPDGTVYTNVFVPGKGFYFFS